MRGMRPADLYKIQWVRGAAISPDGARIAFVVQRLDRKTDRNRSQIWLVDTPGRSAPRAFTSGEGSDTAPAWSPDGRHLAFLSRRNEGEGAQLYVIPVDGGEARRVTDLPHGAGAPTWSPDSRRIAFAARTGPKPPPTDSKDARPARRIDRLAYKLNGEGFTYDRPQQIFVVDALEEGAKARQLTRGRHASVGPAWSPDGRQLAFVSARHRKAEADGRSDLWVVPAEGGRARRLTHTDGAYGGPAWSPDGRSIASIFAPDFPANRTVHVTDLHSGRTRPLDPDFDRQSAGDLFSGSSNPRWLDDRSVAVIAQDHGTANPIVSTEGAGTRWISRGKRAVVSLSIANDGQTAAVVASTLSTPGEVYVVDMASGRMRQRTRLNAAWLGTVQPAPASSHRVGTAAGVEVDYWIMEPANRAQGRRYPVLLNVHGGPFGQYGEDFFDEFQVFSAAGYGVVFCNPRGSSGQSSAFASAIVGNMGGPDFDDVMAAFEAALERMPWADQSRLGILGGSYGGFMTSWAIGHTDRFAAACSERAVNDWYLMQGASDIGHSFNRRYLGERASTFEDLHAVLRQSPSTYVNDMHTPVLILHSENDLRCPMSQAEHLWVSLTQLGRDVEFVRFPDETHELSRSGRPSHRVERFEIILDYFARKLRRRRR